MSPRPKNKKLSRILYTLALVLLAGIFLFSSGALVKYYIESRQSRQVNEALREMKGEYVRPPIRLPSSEGQSCIPDADMTEPSSNLVTVTHPETGEDVAVLKELAELYLLNPDLAGWLEIPNTNINYPVMHRPKDTDYYLYLNYHGVYDGRGCLYAREACDVSAPSDNITIYGHQMLDGSMFAHLSKYVNKSFWEENQYFYFDTLTEHHTYQIIRVFTTTATVGRGFSYHLFVDAETEADFDQFLKNCTAWQLYDTGLTATYGDKLLTLSTCEYTHENGRLVVVAKRID